jgi:putative MATE family efflux protein
MENFDETAPQAEVSYSFWSILREAVWGTNRDLTVIPIGLAIFLLAVPMVIEMFMESLFAIVDIFFVSKLGADAVAVVGITESLIILVYSVAIGLSIGATATVARRIGEKNPDAAAKTAVQVIYLGLIVSAVFGVTGALFAHRFLEIMGAAENVIAHVNFTRVLLGGSMSVVMIFLINGIFRGAGNAAIAMRTLILANTINIVLNPCFIFGLWFFPELGVVGSAVATTIGRSIGVIFAFSMLLRRGNKFEIHAHHWVPDFPLIWHLIKLSSAAILQVSIGMLSWMGLIRIMSGFGSEALAGYVIGIRVILFALLPSVGMSNAAATLVGQSLGAGKPERAEEAVWKAATYNAVFLGTTGLLFVLFAYPIVGLFDNKDPAVVEYAANCLRTVAYGFVFYAFGMVFGASFNGAGDTWTPTYINLFIFWLFEIPLAYVLAYHTDMQVYGVFWAITIAFSAYALITGFMFRRGKWKLQTV